MIKRIRRKVAIVAHTVPIGKLLLFLFCVTFLSGLLSAQCDSANTAFKAGERVEYELNFSWKFVWVKAGKASLSTYATTYKSKPAYRMTLLASGSNRADFFFKLRDTLTCVFDKDLIPYYYRKCSEEGKHYAVDEAWYSYDNNGQCNVSQRRTYKNGRKRVVTSTEDHHVYDMLSILAKARNYNFNSYKIGQQIKFSVVTGRRIENQILTYKGKRNIEAKDGHSYRCHVLSLVQNNNKKKIDEVITFYVSDDNNHLPIRLDLYLNFGIAKAYFLSVSGNRYPLTSRID